MNLNFSMSELVFSDTANKHKINNMPDLHALDCLQELVYFCLQPIRDKLKKPMIITSGYRCPEVNRLVGGVSTSQHTKGQAVDFIVYGMTIKQTIDFIQKTGVEFDQLLNEYNQWVHISYCKGKNRRQVLTIK